MLKGERVERLRSSELKVLKRELKAIKGLLQVTDDPIRLEVLKKWLKETKDKIKLELEFLEHLSLT